MPLLLLILFVAIPIAELYVIIQVGEAIGVLPTLALLIADSILGTVLLRSQGKNAWRKFMGALNEGRVPHREVFDGAMVILGGALLLTPGFISDIFGIIFLLPPTRAVVWQVAKRYVVGHISFGPQVGGFGPRPAGPRPAGPRPGDIDGTAHEVRDAEGNLPPPGDTGSPGA